MSTCDVKSSMESHISHCVAEHFGSRPKVYSKDRIENYLKLEEYFARIKSYIETSKINNVNLHVTLVRLIEDNPYTLSELKID